jgi:hypothetical protein
MYEFVDTIPMILLGPIYEKNWGLLVGFCNCFLRLGSVFNFILSPFIFNQYHDPRDGLKAAFWTSTSIICFGVICAIVSLYFEVIVTKNFNKQSKEQPKHEAYMQPPARRNQTLLMRICDRVLEIIPFHLFTRQYYYFLLGGALLYGAMVPFWFVGSKFLQEGYGLSVTIADMLLLLPEGMITVISIPLGYYLDYLKLSIPTQLRFLALAVSMLTVSYIVLVYAADYKANHHTESSGGLAVFMMVILGCGYGTSNCLLYTCALVVVCGGSANNEKNKRLLGPGTGVLACSMNILPALIPPLGAYIIQQSNGDSGRCILLLSFICILSCSLFLVASCHQPQVDDDNDDTGSIEGVPSRAGTKIKEIAVAIDVPLPKNPVHTSKSKNQQEYVSLRLQDEDDDDVFVL